ncbi:MAG TPA: FTR1 family protein [Longimicrobiaceae bacterium]|nr:FTR1 family protein [Longimicrobiaceae bacterium]
MLQAFVIVLREGFEAFLIISITLAYLRRTGRTSLVGAVYGGIGAAVLASAGLGLLLLRGANLPLWEGIFGLIALPLVVGLVVHMWRAGPQMRGSIESAIEAKSSESYRGTAIMGVFAFTALMITREGMETALLLLQVRQGQLLAGAILGLLASIGMAILWARVGYAINLRRFFQVTGIFLLVFTIQIAITAFHELAEAGVLPASAVLHAATEPFGPEGVYGRWLGILMVGVPVIWLVGTLLVERVRWRFGHSAAA